MGMEHDEDSISDEIDVGSMYDEPSEIPVNPVDLLYQEQEKQWASIEFEEVTAEGAVREALADAATQFHYLYLSQLIVLGDITRNAANLDVKRLAAFLTASRIRDVDAWGRYLASLKMRTTVAEPVRTYCTHMYNDDNRLSRLMGLILADVFRQAISRNTHSFPDPTFKRLIERDLTEGDKNVKLTRRYLKRINRNLDVDEREHVTMQLDRYTVLIDNIIDDRQPAFAQLNVDTDLLREQIRNEIDAFHDDITQD